MRRGPLFTAVVMAVLLSSQVLAAQGPTPSLKTSALLAASSLPGSYRVQPGQVLMPCTAFAGVVESHAYACAQRLFVGGAATVSSAGSGIPIVYEIVVGTKSSAQANRLYADLGARSPWWSVAPYAGLHAAMDARIAAWESMAGTGVALTQDWFGITHGADFALVVMARLHGEAAHIRARTLARTALADLSGGAAATAAGTSTGQLPSSSLLTDQDLGPLYTALPLPELPVSCATLAAGQSGYACAQGMWALRDSVRAVAASRRPLVAYELVVRTLSAAAASRLAQAIAGAGGRPWRMAAYRPVQKAFGAFMTSYLSPAMQSKLVGDWWYFAVGRYFAVLAFLTEHNAHTQAYDQHVRNEAYDFLKGLSGATTSSAAPAIRRLLLTSADLGAGYAAKTPSHPFFPCAELGVGYACGERLWLAQTPWTSARMAKAPVLVYELVVQGSDDQQGAALRSRLDGVGDRPWKLAAFAPVKNAVWNAVNLRVAPSVASHLIGDWWVFSHGPDVGVVMFVIEPTKAAHAFDAAMAHVASGLLNETSPPVASTPESSVFFVPPTLLGSGFVLASPGTSHGVCSSLLAHTTATAVCSGRIWTRLGTAGDQISNVFEGLVQASTDAGARRLFEATIARTAAKWPRLPNPAPVAGIVGYSFWDRPAQGSPMHMYVALKGREIAVLVIASRAPIPAGAVAAENALWRALEEHMTPSANAPAPQRVT